MLEQELQLERDLFFYLNGSESTLLDHFFYLYSNMWIWMVFYFCFLIVFIHKKPWKEWLCLLLAVSLVILFCDQLSSGFFKPFFHRLRPTHHPDFQLEVKTVLGYYGGRFGFISGHAANAFGFATFAALIFKNKLFTTTIFLFATLCAYSRIYLGVHFISDVVVGAIVGAIVGWLVYKLYNFVRHKWLSIDSAKLKTSIFSGRETYFVCSMYYLLTLILLIFNNQLITIFFQNKF
jgi:undecaprenyl-diphosphatase